MISVQQAKEKILAQVLLGPSREMVLEEAGGLILATDILAPMDLPPFDNSAMDGYALRAVDTQAATPEEPVTLKVQNTVAAGDSGKQPIPSGQAVRIFTGAKIPPGADAVVMQEDVIPREHQIELSQPVPLGQHIRRQGEEIRQDSPALHRGQRLNPAALGLLASMGIPKVSVIRPPRVGILVTGSELTSRNQKLQPGKIYDSNSLTLTAALAQMGLSPSFQATVSDDKDQLIRTLRQGLESSDFLLVTGGVSVGEYDFVKAATAQLGLEEILWKVKQKPGKPLFFAQGNPSPFLFGLPGNPASVLVCFYEYVYPALRQAMGFADPWLPSIRIPLRKDHLKKGDRAHFLRGKLSLDTNSPAVELLSFQGSHILKSFSEANVLVFLQEEQNKLQAGDLVECHLLPNFNDW